MSYTITETKELHNQKERRYAVKIHINGGSLEKIKDIIEEANNNFIKEHNDANIVLMYIGHDEMDAVHCNWLYTTEYKHNTLNIKENESYKMCREFIFNNTDNTNAVVNDYKRVYDDMSEILNKVIITFNDLTENKITLDKYYEDVNGLRIKSQSLYVEFSDLKFPSIEYIDIQKNYLNAISDIDNVIGLFADKTVDKKYAIYVFENYKKKYNK